MFLNTTAAFISFRVDAPGLVSCIPALAYQSRLNLPAAFTQPGALNLADILLGHSLPHEDPAGVAELLDAVVAAGAQEVDGHDEEEDVLDPVGGHLEGQEERVGHRQDARHDRTVQEEEMDSGMR